MVPTHNVASVSLIIMKCVHRGWDATWSCTTWKETGDRLQNGLKLCISNPDNVLVIETQLGVFSTKSFLKNEKQTGSRLVSSNRIEIIEDSISETNQAEPCLYRLQKT